MSDIPRDGLPNDWLILIGAVIAQWSQLEWTLNSHISTMLDQPQAAHVRPPHLRIPLNRRIALYRKLAPLFYVGRALQIAETGVKLMSLTKDDREWIVHGWAMAESDGKLSILRTDQMPDNTYKTIDHLFSRERIICACRAMKQARLCLDRAYSLYPGVFAPPPLLDRYEHTDDPYTDHLPSPSDGRPQKPPQS